MAAPNLTAVYGQLCDSYRAIDDFRAKLLGFLPLATGTGIFILVNDKVKLHNIEEFLKPIGIFGACIALGLFLYELYGIKKCDSLINTGKCIECQLAIKGQFRSRPRGIFGIINEPFAGGIIYPAVLAAWIFLATYCESPGLKKCLPIIVFSAAFVITLFYNIWLGYFQKRECSCVEVGCSCQVAHIAGPFRHRKAV
jgi:hypothetical protein